MEITRSILTLCPFNAFKVHQHSYGCCDSDLSKNFQKEPLPIFHALLLMLVNPRWIPRGSSGSLDFDFQRMLESAFTEKDNPYLANTFYQHEDGEKFSALDRLNHLWYLMFSGFTLEHNSPPIVPFMPVSEDIPSECQTEMLLPEFPFEEPLSVDILNVPPRSQKLFDKSNSEENGFGTSTMGLSGAVLGKSTQEKRLEFSRDQFLNNIPNPNMIFKRSKSQKSLRLC